MTDSQAAVLLAIVAMATTACATVPVTVEDELCSELAMYAGSAAKASPVVLRGGWGGDTKNVLMTHDCEFFGSNSGERFCAYLVANTSWEFGRNNLTRLAACIDDSVAAQALDAAADRGQPSEILATVATPGGGSAGLVMHYTPTSRSSGLYTPSIAVPHSGP